ncbi:hypothetical protein D3C85_1132900 [compost metagenome]
MHQGQVVVVEDAQVDIAAAQAKALAEHVGDAVGERMQLAEGVAALALDVDQRFAVGETYGEVAHGAGKIHSCRHCCSPYGPGSPAQQGFRGAGAVARRGIRRP